jgi:hypothetical protein
VGESLTLLAPHSDFGKCSKFGKEGNMSNSNTRDYSYLKIFFYSKYSRTVVSRLTCTLVHAGVLGD